MQIKNNKILVWAGIAFIIWWFFYRTRVKQDAVIDTAPPTNTLRSANVGYSYAASSPTPPTQNTVPFFAAGFPKFEYNHAKFELTNSGTFSVVLKEVGGAVVESTTITGPTTSTWLSKVLPQDGKAYELIVNSATTTVTAPNEVQADSEYTDINLQD